MPLFEPIFEALNWNGVRYLVVGGVAVVLHGYARLTADLDLIVDLSPIEARKAIETLVGLGLRPTAPIDFEQLWVNSELIELEEETRVRVASIPDLIRLKRLAGRPLDLADVEALEEILRRREPSDA